MADKIKFLRIKAGHTQETAAEKLGVTLSTYARWENYKTFPNVVQFKKMCKVFGCKMEDVYFPEV